MDVSGQYVSMGSLDHSQWYQCDSCGWYGYFGPDVPQERKLYDIDGCKRWFLCRWCYERSNGCSDWFHTAPRCDWCGWVGDDAGIQKIPKDVAAVHNYGINDGNICEYCINRLRAEDDGDKTDEEPHTCGSIIVDVFLTLICTLTILCQQKSRDA